jgi:hypothetical protein
LFHDCGAWKAALTVLSEALGRSSDADGTGGDNHGCKKDGTCQDSSRGRS